METILNFDYAAHYSLILEPFKGTAFGPRVATGLLVVAVGVLIGFTISAFSKFHKLRTALYTITDGTASADDFLKRSEFNRNFEKIDTALLANTAISGVWREFRETLLLHDRRADAIENSTRPQNFFNLRNLHVHYDFVRSLPNFFVGIGLLGTFIGLIAALTYSTVSLTKAGSDPEQVKSALSVLLTTAAAKFYISAAGLLASIVLSLFIKYILKHLHHLVHQLNDALEERLLFVSELALADKQLTAQRDSLQELKLFNTNIAMKIGDAVREAVQDSNNTLTDKLSSIATTFEKLVDASREGAGKAVDTAMNTALETSLGQASEAIGYIAAELGHLPKMLSATAAQIEQSGRAASEQQAALAETVQNAVGQIVGDILTRTAERVTSEIDQSMSGLKASGAVFGESATKITAFLDRFGASGDDYIKSLSALATENSKIESNLAAISGEITVASESVRKAAETVDKNLEKILTGIGDFSRISSETSRTVQKSQESIQSTVDAMQKQMAQHIQRFDSVDQKLVGVFGQMSKHLETQGSQMAEQLSRMDQALASAVNQFEQLIEDLTDAISQRK